jgi:hypothetical protein
MEKHDIVGIDRALIIHLQSGTLAIFIEIENHYVLLAELSPEKSSVN